MVKVWRTLLSRQQHYQSRSLGSQRLGRRARKKAIQSRLKICESRAKQRKRDARTQQPSTSA